MKLKIIMMNDENEHLNNMTESYSEISNFLTSSNSAVNTNSSSNSNSGKIINKHYNSHNNKFKQNSDDKNDHNVRDDDYDDDDDEDDNDDDEDDDDTIEKDTTNNLQKRPKSLISAFPYNLEGTVSKDGDMTHFVAENLEYKIKLSSPITKKDVYQQCSSSRNSTPSAQSSSLLPHNFLCPQLSQIDSNVLNDIEIEAQYLAASVDNLTENLCNLLHSVSSITADNIEIHKNAVNKLTDCMDANIKCMYTIMAKTEEISKSMKPTEQLAVKIREIKKLVDMLESSL